ncbi:TPA: nickel insertion protein [Streptococcus suis]
MTSEALGFVLEELIADSRVLDAYLTPIQMKKNRPGHLLTVLSYQENCEELEEYLLTETSTFGVRKYETERTVLERTFIKLRTEFGLIQFKLGFFKERLIKLTPEFEDMKAIALELKVPFPRIYQSCLKAAEDYLRGNHSDS